VDVCSGIRYCKIVFICGMKIFKYDCGNVFVKYGSLNKFFNRTSARTEEKSYYIAFQMQYYMPYMGYLGKEIHVEGFGCESLEKRESR